MLTRGSILIIRMRQQVFYMTLPPQVKRTCVARVHDDTMCMILLWFISRVLEDSVSEQHSLTVSSNQRRGHTTLELSV